MANKIVRSVCYFAENLSDRTLSSLDNVSSELKDKGFEIQTKRLCSPNIDKVIEVDSKVAAEDFILSVGTLPEQEARKRLPGLLGTKDTSFNIDLTKGKIDKNTASILFEIIKQRPEKTFNFTYVFNNEGSTAFFPSASYERNGFSVALQPTDLAENCQTLDQWLQKMKETWNELNNLFKYNKEFLGIDSSIAPLFEGKSSFINFVKKLGYDFSKSTTTNLYVQVTKFLAKENPKAVGLCGLMFPCLEDFELADEYEKGNFSVERNIYLSLHSGLGIDTYPIGIDESPERVAEILSLLQELSNKYKKPLSARFVSDGKAKIGNKTDFGNQYLKDVAIKPL